MSALGCTVLSFSMIACSGGSSSAVQQVTAPVATVSVPSLTFTGTVGDATRAQSVTLSNAGNAALEITGISVTGSNPGSFTETNNCAASLAVDANCTILVTFKAGSAGSFTASIAIVDNATGSPQQVSLSGTGTAPAPVAVLAPTSLTFTGIVGIAGDAQAVTLSNLGSAPLTISGIAVDGTAPADFSQTNNCAVSLAVGASCTISVVFAPGAAGAFSAFVMVADNAPGSPQQVSLSGTATGPAPTAEVDFGTSEQTVRGFGGSSAWISDFTDAQADSLFGNGSNQQIGLSLLRVRIDPAGQANWGTELSNAQKAGARGASVIATPWSPPAAMKINTNANPLWGGSLNPSSYGDYASYLESFVTYMSNGGVNLYAISMQNEPDANVTTYEACTWTPAQMDTWVANNAEVLTTKLMMPESESFNQGYSDPTLNDAGAVGNVAIVAGHIYGTVPASYPNATSHGKELWMTEHYTNDTGITGAMEMAKEINDSMAGSNYNAYVWWWLQNYAAGSYTQGLMDSSNNLTLNGYTLGQFSKFIRPGYVRSNATYNPSGSVYVSAYKSTDNAHFVIVAINTGSAPVGQPFAISNETITQMTPYRTSATENLGQMPSVTVTAGSFTYTLPAQSITTFVE
jgi:glucuronoarabinoxylan endo-1,4-beta-xylanase